MAAAEGEEPEFIEVQDVAIEPNHCPLEVPVTVSLQFCCREPLPDCSWHVCYEADYTGKRHVIELCSTPSETYEPGKNAVDLEIPPVNTEGVKEKRLLSMGLLRCTLSCSGKEIASVNVVTQVQKEDGRLIRNMMNPLE
eukprot:TRINITY_DN47065_c0_g1_i1.p1 TRINITY_DN47065_c0_g1~~TRINITY_DN47065_c0_g1_i1.p1  ORF type:complete len:139 (+),score=49.83 TRINITY_DN47065_c0_g1_i1:73-489(+)